MKANELRIGNLVKCDRYPSKSYKIRLYDFATYLQTSPEDYSPIPLTEEWLLKFGGIKSVRQLGDERLSCELISYKLENTVQVHQWAKKESILNDTFILQIGVLCLDTAELDYVHQLQNLYFALTGEELTIK